VTKADLITIIADRLKFPWARAELLVDVVFGCLEQSMSRGEKIEIRATQTIPIPANALASISRIDILRGVRKSGRPRPRDSQVVIADRSFHPTGVRHAFCEESRSIVRGGHALCAADNLVLFEEWWFRRW
jgi:hypothetical protein